jgi:sugar lactone lactonase YvrE
MTIAASRRAAAFYDCDTRRPGVIGPILAVIGLALGSLATAQPANSLPAAATPVISLAAGTYASAQTVTITDETPESTIYCTTNGAIPTVNSTMYTGALEVPASETLVAIATAKGYSHSAAAGAQYVIGSHGAELIYTFAGNGIQGYSGDGGPATLAQVNYSNGVAFDKAGNLYFADSTNNRIRKIAVGTRIITTVAGTGIAGYSGEGGPATNARLDSPLSVAFDGAGEIYISDYGNGRIRIISAATGVITTFKTSTDASHGYATGLAFDTEGNLYIADAVVSEILKVTAGTGVIKIFAGNGNFGCGGDGEPASSAALSYPQGIAVDRANNVYIADWICGSVRKVSAGNEKRQ